MFAALAREAMWAALGVAAVFYLLPQIVIWGRAVIPAWLHRRDYRAHLSFSLRLPTLEQAFSWWSSLTQADKLFVFDWDNLVAQQGSKRLEPEYVPLFRYLLASNARVVILTKSRQSLREGLAADLGPPAQHITVIQFSKHDNLLIRFARGKPFAYQYRQVELLLRPGETRDCIMFFDDKFENCAAAVQRGWQARCTRAFSPFSRMEWVWLQPVRNWLSLRGSLLSGPGHELHVSLDWLFFWAPWPFDLMFAHRDSHGNISYTRRGQKVPNFLCWARIGGAFVASTGLMWSVSAHEPGWSKVFWWLLLVFVLTDALDGRLARHMDSTPRFARDADIVERGGELDPVSDKLANVFGAIAAVYIAVHLTMSVHVGLFLLLAGLALGIDLGLSLMGLVDHRNTAKAKALQALVVVKDNLPPLPKLQTFKGGKAKMLLYATGFMVELAEPVWVGPPILRYAWPFLLVGMPFGVLSFIGHLYRSALILFQLWTLQALYKRQQAAAEEITADDLAGVQPETASATVNSTSSSGPPCAEPAA